MLSFDGLTNIYRRMRKIVFRMELKKYLVGFFIIMLALSQGCIDTGNLPGMGPKEVSVDLSTPEGVIEAYWRYIDIGKYDEVYDLFCDEEYFNQLPRISRDYTNKERFIDYMINTYGENGEKIDSGSPRVTGKGSITGYEATLYGVGDIVEEGYGIGCEAGRLSIGANIRGGGIVVRYKGRWCIASE